MFTILATSAFGSLLLDATTAGLAARLSRDFKLKSGCTEDGADPYGSGHFVQCCSGMKKCLEESAHWEYRCKSCSDSCPNDKSWEGRACAGGSPSPAPSGGGGGGTGGIDATTLHWNAHRPCATSESACVSLAQQRLGEMAKQVGAQIVGAVELKDSINALPGWQNTGMQCDNSAVMVAPGWTIESRGGYCMNGDDVKGLAVALVVPPQAVQGCPKLCIMMGHVPHGGVQSGGSEIEEVCGDARHSCGIAMADWNSATPSARFDALYGTEPKLIEPHSDTCCWDRFEFQFDHTVSNIEGAYSDGDTIFPPQLTKFPSYDEHKPTSVKLRLPNASLSG